MTQGLGRIVVAGNLSLDDTINPTGAAPDLPGGDALYAAVGVRLWGGDAWLLTLAGDDYPPADFAQMHDLGSRHRPRAARARPDGPLPRPRRARRLAHVHPSDAGGPARRHLTRTAGLCDACAGCLAPPGGHAPAGPHRRGERGPHRAGAVLTDPHEEYVVGHEQTIATLATGAAFMPSELELELLFPDLAVGTTGTGLALAAGVALDAWRPRFLAMKVGAAGSVVREGGQATQVPADPVEVVDPIGAGDAYGGGFIVGYLASGSVVVGAACGAVAAAEVISRFGAFPLVVARALARGPGRAGGGRPGIRAVGAAAGEPSWAACEPAWPAGTRHERGALLLRLGHPRLRRAVAQVHQRRQVLRGPGAGDGRRHHRQSRGARGRYGPRLSRAGGHRRGTAGRAAVWWPSRSACATWASTRTGLPEDELEAIYADEAAVGRGVRQGHARQSRRLAAAGRGAA